MCKESLELQFLLFLPGMLWEIWEKIEENAQNSKAHALARVHVISFPLHYFDYLGPNTASATWQKLWCKILPILTAFNVYPRWSYFLVLKLSTIFKVEFIKKSRFFCLVDNLNFKHLPSKYFLIIQDRIKNFVISFSRW